MMFVDGPIKCLFVEDDNGEFTYSIHNDGDLVVIGTAYSIEEIVSKVSDAAAATVVA